MKKSIYLPQMVELKQMEMYQNVNVYKYILVKTVEKLIFEGRFVKDMDHDLMNINELIDSICYLYPQELRHLNMPNNNVILCDRILSKEEDKSIYNLDSLADFSYIVQTNYDIMVETIDLLYKKLADNPTYRFNYRESLTLNKIFGVDLLYFDKYSKDTIDKLMYIDPIYGIKQENIYGSLDGIKFIDAMEEYAYRYGIPYDARNEKSIFEDQKTKKLIRYLYK